MTSPKERPIMHHSLSSSIKMSDLAPVLSPKIEHTPGPLTAKKLDIYSDDYDQGTPANSVGVLHIIDIADREIVQVGDDFVPENFFEILRCSEFHAIQFGFLVDNFEDSPIPIQCIWF